MRGCGRARLGTGLSEGLSVRMGIGLFAGVGPAQRAQERPVWASGNGREASVLGEPGSVCVCVCYLQLLGRNTKYTISRAR